MNPRPSVEALLRFYREKDNHESERGLAGVLKAEEEYPNATTDAERMLRSIRALDRTAEPKRLLDIGAGYGFFSRAAKGYQVTAIEACPRAGKIAEKVSGVLPLPVSFEEYSSEEGQFSAVLMSQVLEHSHDVQLWISKAARLLKRGGVLAIALPSFSSIFRLLLNEREAYICPPEHLNFFSRRCLSALLAQNGLKVRSVNYVSRIPRMAIQKRFPFLGAIGVHASWLAATAILRAVDTMNLGMMLNVYATKECD
ncbi:MAG TPA: class I SAM-dependent methyltransferase [Planctomycetota bacterium]